MSYEVVMLVVAGYCLLIGIILIQQEKLEEQHKQVDELTEEVSNMKIYGQEAQGYNKP